MLHDEASAAWMDAHSLLRRFAVYSRGDILPEQWVMQRPGGRETSARKSRTLGVATAF
jgi:hypothetical protein